MNVSLTPQLEEFITKKVATGLYGSASEVIREGLRLLEEQDRLREARLGDLRTKIDEGLEQLARGERAAAGEVFQRIREKSRRKQHGGK